MHGGGSGRLLNNASLELRRGHRYGLVGRNGKGKTTLMSKLAANELDLDKALIIRYVQYETLLHGVDPTISCAEYAKRFSTSSESCDQWHDARLDHIIWEKSAGQLSGGWRMRLALAVAFSERADLYLLDEPTNHLDFDGVAWLELQLMRLPHKSTVVIVSHDGGFLDRTCTDVIHVSPEGKLEYYVDVAASIMMKKAQEASETGWSVVYPTSTAPPGIVVRVDESAITLPDPDRDGLGHVVASLVGCNYRYMNMRSPILKDVTLQVTMKCRVGVIGPNGAGKTTLLNLLARELMPVVEGSEEGGAVWHHENLRLAYIAQQHFHHLSEYFSSTPVQYIQHRFGSDWDEELRKRLVMSQKPSDVLLRSDLAAKHGGKPYYFDAELGSWKGRQVERIRERRLEGVELQYLVRWHVSASESEQGISSPDTWESAQKLRFMGVEMLCLAFDSQQSYARIRTRSKCEYDVIQHLKSVGIAEDMTRRPIKSFSAGQMSKLVLAASLWTRPHVLLLDEPTNFLDAKTVEALSLAVKTFKGGVVIASHNLDFLDKTCNEFWKVDDGHVLVVDANGSDRGSVIAARLRVQASRDRERRAKEVEKQLRAADSSPDDVGRVLDRQEVACAFHRFLGLNVPDYAVDFAVDHFVAVAEERQPPKSDEWLAVLIAAVQMAESIGFEELGNITEMAAILSALLKYLLQTRSIGSVDDGADRSMCDVNRLRSLQFREKAVYFEECCYCGRQLGRKEIQSHEKTCWMSPSRCGRHLQGNEFEMFHGTSRENAHSIERYGFRPTVDGMLGPGVYCSRDLRKARRYGAVVLRLSVQLGRVIKIDKRGHPLQKIWQTEVGGSFDAAWVPPNSGVVPSGLEENCVRSPSQIVILGRVNLSERHVF
eukprot:TRINITY_DN20843_c0_g3_i1.p1 TRINITY_DN20843_c0_g3~~TRINITY_DN20843_c0_g3_i1.p1  ORF type:complete len:884 (-),score=113.95 TRINITY_DN20843_c0_g3_i1:213-2864(-)